MLFKETVVSLRPYFKGHIRAMLVGMLAMVITDFCVLLTPKLQAHAIRAIENRDDMKIVFLYSFAVFGVIALAGVFRYMWRVFYINASMKIAYEIRNDIMRKLMSFSPRFYSQYTTGDLMARATNDLEAVRMATGPGILFGLDIIVLGIPSICILFIMNWKLALMALAPAPFIAVLVFYFEKKIHIVFEKVQAQFSLLSEKVRENVAGIRVIKTYTQEEAEVRNFEELSRNYVKHNMKMANIDGMFRPIITFFATLSIIIILLSGLKSVVNGTMDLGDFWAFNEYMWFIVWPMIGIGWIVSMVQRGTASMKRLNEILERAPDIVDPENPLTIGKVKGDIEFRNVSFKYEDDAEWALRNISFKLKAGEKLGIAGKVGSGKTALINLLLRFYDPQEGEILLDGVNIKNIAVKELRNSFGFIPQETFLFSDTIKNNIAFGIKDYTEEMIKDVASVAQLYENIQEFPKKFDTLVGEKGVTLSGGQKQRTAISRALIVDPAIIVFDDAFSSLDTETEEKILNNLEGKWKGRTTVVISHRVSTIRNFDCIIVLEGGHISEKGKHEELIDKKGIYFQIYEHQKLEEALA